MISKNRDQNQDNRTGTRILDVAEPLFAQTGFAGTSTRAIAEEAQANIGLIAYYFGSKEGLFEAVISRRAHELIRLINQSINQSIPPAQAYAQFLVLSARFLIERHRSFLLLIGRESLVSEPTPLSHIVENHLDPHQQMLVALLNAGMAEGIFRPLEPSLHYELILASFAAVAKIPDGPQRESARSAVVDFLTAATLNGADRSDNETTAALEIVEESAQATPVPPQREDEDPFGIGIFD